MRYWPTISRVHYSEVMVRVMVKVRRVCFRISRVRVSMRFRVIELVDPWNSKQHEHELQVTRLNQA